MNKLPVIRCFPRIKKGKDNIQYRESEKGREIGVTKQKHKVKKKSNELKVNVLCKKLKSDRGGEREWKINVREKERNAVRNRIIKKYKGK